MGGKRLILFERNKKLLSNTSGRGIEIVANSDPAILEALTGNTPFPDREIALGDIIVSAEGEKNIEFSSSNDKVVFRGSANASVFSGLGVYRNSKALLDVLMLDDNITPELDPDNNDEDNGSDIFMLLRWGYDLGNTAKGSVALGGPASVTFGADGKREKVFAVIRKLPRNTGVLDAVHETVNSWILPSQIQSIDDLEPGTWIVTEVESDVTLSLGGQFGYDFNWVREAREGGLTGDIGLRLQLGVDVALGFQAGGKFALMIGRDSENPTRKKLRLRLFKQRIKGWNFAMDTGVTVAGDFTEFSKNFDDFIKAVFGIHGTQVVKELEVIEKWTDHSHDISKLLGGLSLGYFKKLVQDITGIDPAAAFHDAKARLLDFLKIWRDLDHVIATQLWKLAEDRTGSGLEDVRKLLEKISEEDEESTRLFLREKITNVNYFQTTTGQFLLSLVPGESILTILSHSGTPGRLQGAAQKTIKIFDGGQLEEVFVNLQQVIGKRLDLDKIEQIVSETELEELDEWMKLKLSRFLGKNLDRSGLADLDEIRRTIHLLLDKRRAFYENSLKALKRKYELNFNSTYQKTTAGEALIDVSFNFDKGDPGELLRQALNGRFDRLMVEKHPGIKLHKATLTHAIDRNSSVEVSFPFYKSSISHINSSLAKVNAVDEDEGRILIYELGTTDVVVRKNLRTSTLAIGGYLIAEGNQVRIHSTNALTYSYTFRQASKNMKRADLQYQLKPYVNVYFPSAFSAPRNSTASASFDTWLGDLDKTIDQIEYNGTDNFGHTLFSLEMSLSSKIASSWLNTPSNRKAAEYMNMSRALQAKLKELIPLYYFKDVENYNNIRPASFLLAYAAIPPSTSVQMSRGRLKMINTDMEVYWNWPDRNLQAAMLNNSSTAARLSVLLQQACSRLKATPGMERKARFYDPAQLTRFLENVVNDRHSESYFRSLFFVEASIIQGAYKAALKMSEFVKESGTKPSDAVKTLADFGSEITRAFNKNIKSTFGGDEIRPLGTIMFLEAALALDPGLSRVESIAILDLIVLKQSTEFNFKSFLEKGDVPHDEILLHERLIEFD